MKTELQEKLIKKYPKFFDYLKEHTGPIIPIQFGFECGDGWYFILHNLMDDIYKYCELNDKEIPSITQIKEKYGALCFYYNGGNDLIHGMVMFAETLSYTTCETCGTNKKVGHTEGWIYTQCKPCYNKNKRAKDLEWTEYKI